MYSLGIVNVVGAGKRKCDGIWRGSGLVGGGLKLEGVCVDTFPMVLMVRVTEINLGSVKKNTNRPPSPAAVCVRGE